MTHMTRRWLLATFFACIAIVMLLLAAKAKAAPSFTFQCVDPSGPPVTLCEVYLDPDVHHGTVGTVLYHGTSSITKTIPLPDGAHKIAVRSSANVSGGVNTSVITMTYPSTCQAGWAQLGYQAWWADTGQDPTFESRHEHWDNLCIPANNLIVDGPVTFTPTIQLHNQPAGAVFYRYRITDCLSGCHDILVRTSGLPQPDTAGNLVFPVSMPVDLSKLAAGRHEFRFGVYVRQPNGKVQLLSSRAELCIRSCSPSYRSLSTFPILQGNGAWYEKDTNPGYIDARIRSALP
jgi:hypothetical protein